jgi:two-component system sensor histidine kinase/response regulator
MIGTVKDYMTKVASQGEASNQGDILIVDDDGDIISFLSDFFSGNGYRPTGYASAREALDALKEQKYDLLLADLMMPEMDGIELLRAALKIDPSLIVIIMTGYGTIRTAIEARKAGAFEYVLKPFKANELLTTVSRAMETRSTHSPGKE